MPHTSESGLTLIQRTIRLAADWDCVLATHQFGEINVDDAGIRRLLAQELIARMHRGVYLVGVPVPTMRARLRGATLRGGRCAYVGGLGALWLAGAVEREPRKIELVSTSRSSRFDGVVMERTSSLPERERRSYDGLPAVSAARAIADLAPRFPSKRIIRWMRNAEYHGTLSLDDLRAAEHRLARRGHGTNLRDILRDFDDGDGGTDSGLEDLLHELLVGANFPLVRTGQAIPGVLRENERVDFLFAEYGLVIEADGPHHLEEMQRATDRRRDRALRRAGYRVLRFWWYEIEDDPIRVLDRIRAALVAS